MNKKAALTAKRWRERMKKEKPWYAQYHNARMRCYYKSSNRYRYYGGRGIECFMKLEDFEKLWFRDKAYTMARPTIDRIDNDGNYVLENCRYIELSENSRRRIEHIRGEDNNNSKLKEKEVKIIKEEEGRSNAKDLAKKFNCGVQAIRDIWKGRTWRWL